MSTFHAPRPGAPTFTAAPASLSLSGLDDFAPLAAESDMMEPEWYHGQDHYHHPNAHVPPPPALSPVDELVVSAGFAFAPHGVPVTDEAFAGELRCLSFPSLVHDRLVSVRIAGSSLQRACIAQSGVDGCRMSSLHYFARHLT
jgi:hypothetical protein